MATPLVSVVLAARDAEATISEAVQSVLGQSVRDLELVVVDDGSEDETGRGLDAVGDERLQVVRNDTPLGLAGALNVGLDAARGTYVARMDADDVALPGWLDAVVGRIAREPPVAVVGTGMIDLLPDGGLGTVHRMRARPSSPIALRRTGSPARISSRSASACVSWGRTRKPVSPSSTTSGTPPTFVATTGRPAASASMIVTGVPSLTDVSTTASQIAYHGATSSW